MLPIPPTSQTVDRPSEPDAPMQLEGRFVPGDASLMARCMLEEMLQVGISTERLTAMTHDPQYQALYALRRTLGDSVMNQLIDQTVQRVGRHRHRTIEHAGDVQPVSLTIQKRDH